MPRPCVNDHPRSPHSCQLCRLLEIDAAYAAYWGEQSSAPIRAINPRCRHRLPGAGDQVNCPSCGGHVRLKTFGCFLHGKCLPMHTVNGIQCCLRCGDRNPNDRIPAAGGIRHLIYHVFPLRGASEPIWRENIHSLLRRISLFNGRRIVGVAVDKFTFPPTEVQSAFGKADIEIFSVPNNPNLREGATYLHSLREISRYTCEADCFFFGHTKGMTSGHIGTANHLWRDACYRMCLDYWPHVQELLKEYPIVGPFYRGGFRFSQVPSCSWHFSGSFRWCRSRDVFSRLWDALDQAWVSAETWPARIFESNEAGKLGPDVPEPGLGLYQIEYWNSRATRECDEWYQKVALKKRKPVLMSIVLCSHRKPRWVLDAVASVQSQSLPDWELIVIDSGSLYATLAGLEADARIRVYQSPQGALCQGWQHNWALSSGLVRGDLVQFLSDDDCLHPHTVAVMTTRALDRPDESVWYGLARRCRVNSLKETTWLGVLDAGRDTGPHGPPLFGRIDGGQLVLRKEVALATPWPTDESLRAYLDAHWMEFVRAKHAVYRVPEFLLDHRHTPDSAHTQEG